MTARPELIRKLAKLFLEAVPKERERLTALSDLLGLIYSLYRREKDFRGFMLNPTIDNSVKLGFLKTLRERLKLGEEVDRVLSYVIELNAVPLLGEVKRVYEHEVEKLLRVSKALLVLARSVSDEELEKIKSAIKRLTGRDYEFEVIEDPSLIGGFLLKTSSLVIDASIRRSLEVLTRS
ncbi:MAG: F0F1 ATP synthase subunit delta [Aquificaceae bacterium]|jgi:F-type H+-transporting ATPase subunit delta